MSDDETRSKDSFFQQLADISSAMIAAHGRDFAIGTLVLAARFAAEHAPPETEDAVASDNARATTAT